MAIKRDRPFDALVPSDIAELFAELGLEHPDPMWYVGRLDERKRNGHSSPPQEGHAEENGADDQRDEDASGSDGGDDAAAPTGPRRNGFSS